MGFVELIVGAAAVVGASASCSLKNDTNIAYSIVNGVGPASKIWVEDFLWWWKSYDSSINYAPLSAKDFQGCDFASFPNLRVYINPGGNAYDQLSAMGPVGTQNLINFVKRDQKNPSSYVGFCAGGYVASTDFIWETLYEGKDYYNFAVNPPLGLFPHSVEGSIVDINDEQYGDQSGSMFRLVNVSNGHKMLYYGGSTWGWNGVSDPTDPKSDQYDPEVEVLVYYTDFYGYYSHNIPAAWRYQNLVLTSVHPEADNCTNVVDSDCPPADTIPTDNILQNRAWLAEYVNQAAQTSYKIPPVPLAPVFDTSAPHTSTPQAQCYSDTTTAAVGKVLFCDGFDWPTGFIPIGLSPQFQRNQTDYNFARPWNTSYVSEWNDGTVYGGAQAGNGYAVVVPMAAVGHHSSITTKPFDVSACSSVNVNFYTMGKTLSNGAFSVEYAPSDTAYGVDRDDPSWVVLHSKAMNPAMTAWTEMSFDVTMYARYGNYMQLRFTCAAGATVDNYCGLDSLVISC
jgi:glutamine amidotransferase-like uncharacterized protein